ncbi:MAG: Tetratricopeptide 2 repeat protein [Bryobacterales bacterium]|nr:Tetratricopeptide 2 repeat protein [Bryobacterales bacterium]
MAAACGACSRSGRAVERVAFLPIENLTGDPAPDWISTAGPKIVTDQLLGGTGRTVPVQAGALRDAYASGATQLVHGYFEKRGQGLHYEFMVEDTQTHKVVQTVAGDGDTLPALDRLAKQIDSGAHPFSSTNPEAVAAWARGEPENAVSLDQDFGAAWLSWVQARAAAGNTQDAFDIVVRALRQPSLRSPVDRAQLELAAATFRQDEPAQQRALAALAQLMPHDSALLRRLATQEMNARRFSQAAQFYQAALREDPDDIDSWNMLGYAQAFAGDVDSAQKSFERYGSDPARAANALDSQGEAAFLNGRFSEAEKYFLEAHAKSPAMLGGGDLLKAAYARWLKGDLTGADQLFAQYLAFRSQQKDPMVAWRQAVWEYSTGRPAAAIDRLTNVTRLPSVSGPPADLARTQLAVWSDLSKLPHDPAALKQVFERTPPTSDGITRVLFAAALAQAGQKDEARKLLVLWPLPGAEGDPLLLQSLLFPKYLELKQQLK